MLNPKVTVVTITYNLLNAGRERMFQQCLESVRQQDYPNIEHIVIDGASTDGTLKIIQQYAQKEWITFFSEPDTGIYNAMNKGVQKATGKYIVFLNSDDFFHGKDGIQKMVTALENSQADFGFAPCRYLTESDKFIGHLCPVIDNFFIRMPCSHQTLFVKTDVMRQLNGFDETFRSAGDYDFVIRLCMSGATYVEIPDNFVSYRLGGLSDKQQEQSINECIKSFEKNYAQFHVKTDYTGMYHELRVPVSLIQQLSHSVCPDLRQKMLKTIQKSKKTPANECLITHYPLVQTTTTIEKTKWLLFGSLPVLSLISKQDGKIKTYAFFGLPIIHVFKQFNKCSYRILGVQLFQRKEKNNTVLYKFFYLPLVKIKKA